MLGSKFKMKDLGSAKKILGMEITRDRSFRKLSLRQRDYLEKMLLKFGLNDLKPVATTLTSQFKLRSCTGKKADEEKVFMEKIPYANIVGFVMYAMICTHPDLSHGISVLSRFMADPDREHWYALKWLLRYIKGTLSKGLVFGNANYSEGDADIVTGYVDSDFAGCLDTQKSLIGYVFIVFGTAIGWKVSLQKVVALSSIEA